MNYDTYRETLAPTILTNKGAYFRFDMPHQHTFDVEEIAHALSNLCRFTGHVREFYSVAQHSVLTSMLVDYKYKLDALFHDASEAYLGDVASPLKRMLPEYKVIEQRVEKAIAEQFCLNYPLPAEVKHADGRMLMTEKRDLIGTVGDEHLFATGCEPAGFIIEPLPPKAAFNLFMQRYAELTDTPWLPKKE